MLAVLKARQLTAVEISEALNVNYDTLHKQTMLLRRSGLLDERFGEDRRYTVFSIPPAFTAIPGWLDFDVCRIRLPEDAAPPPPESGQEIEGVAMQYGQAAWRVRRTNLRWPLLPLLPRADGSVV